MGWNYPIRSDDEGPSRMVYEGCPNQNPNLDDVTAYSVDEEEVALESKRQFL